jgi:hypothetical protein
MKPRHVSDIANATKLTLDPSLDLCAAERRGR